jgi:c-di-GMP-binding flagellar brake protein YcgR
MFSSFNESESRRHMRRKLRGAASLSWPEAMGLDVRMRDVSIGGIGVVSEIDFQPGTDVGVQFAIPQRSRGALKVASGAVVIHSVFGSDEGGFKLGLRFTDLDERFAAWISSYIR